MRAQGPSGTTQGFAIGCLIEDVDVIAGASADRPASLLFQLLDEMDGLGAEVDVSLRLAAVLSPAAWGSRMSARMSG